MKSVKTSKKIKESPESISEIPSKDILSEALKTVVGDEIKKRLMQLGLDLELDFRAPKPQKSQDALPIALGKTPSRETALSTPTSIADPSLPVATSAQESSSPVGTTLSLPLIGLEKIPTLGHLQGLPHPIVNRLQTDPSFRAGYLYQSVGNFTAAIVCYSRSIQNAPSAESHTYLGWVLCLMGEIDGAILHARKAVELNAEYGTAWNDLGAYLVEKFSYDEAIECLTRALKSKSLESPAITYFNLGRALMSKGLFVRGQEALTAAIAADPKFVPAAKLLEQLTRQLH